MSLFTERGHANVISFGAESSHKVASTAWRPSASIPVCARAADARAARGFLVKDKQEGRRAPALAVRGSLPGANPCAPPRLMTDMTGNDHVEAPELKSKKREVR